MNILIIGHNSWDEDIAGGNTLSNFFSGWDEANLSYLYSRKAKPNNKICSHYFTIPEKDILLNLFSRDKIGHEFNFSHDVARNENTKDKIEESVLKKLKKFDSGLLRLFIDFLWISKRWYNKNYRSYIKKSNPDIVFAYAANFARLYALLNSIKTITNTKIVLFIADDVYHSHKNGLFHYIHWKIEQYYFKECVKLSQLNYGASDQLCVNYKRIFNANFFPLYKKCEFYSERTKEKVNDPIQIVYAGNLYYGRANILLAIGKVLDSLNFEECKMILNLYTNSQVPVELEKFIDSSNSVSLKGTLPYHEIVEKLAQADIVLHVESFIKNQIRKTRYSFSTKIIDCIQSGSCFMAIGPSEIASIDYAFNIPGAVVITDLKKIEETLVNILKNPSQLVEKANESLKFAKNYHGESQHNIKFKNRLANLLIE